MQPIEVGTFCLVVGIQASGKTWFSRRLIGGIWPELNRITGISRGAEWVISDIRGLRQLSDVAGRSEVNLLLECGVLRVFGTDWMTVLPLKLAAGAARWVIVTLWCEPHVLAKRIFRRLLITVLLAPWRGVRLLLRGDWSRRTSSTFRLEARASFLNRVKHFLSVGLRLHASLGVFYLRKPDAITSVYARWLEHAAELEGAQHWLLDVSAGSPRITSIQDWKLDHATDRRCQTRSTTPLIPSSIARKLVGNENLQVQDTRTSLDRH